MHHDEFGSELDPVQRHGVRPVAFADGAISCCSSVRKSTHQVVAYLTAGRPIGPLALSATGKLHVGEALECCRQLTSRGIDPTTHLCGFSAPDQQFKI